MMNFLFTLTITFSLLLLTVVLISYCKRRQNRTNHGLTGMCHESGGTMCGCCSSQLLTQSSESPKKSMDIDETNITILRHLKDGRKSFKVLN